MRQIFHDEDAVKEVALWEVAGIVSLDPEPQSVNGLEGLAFRISALLTKAISRWSSPSRFLDKADRHSLESKM
jgi:hypothetical protein